MNRSLFSRALAAASLTAFLLIPSARSAEMVNFSEDFESYAPGSNLVGQNGWDGSGPGRTSQMVINPGTYIGSQVLDGRDPAGTGWIMYAGHAVDPVKSSEVTTLKIDAYATTSPATINSGFGIGNDPAPDGSNYFDAFVFAWSVNASTGGWTFDTRSVGGSTELVNAGIDEEMSLEIVIDGPAGEVYGVLEGYNSGRHETAHVPVSAAVINALDAVAIVVDKSASRTGATFDNLVLSSELPLPAGITFLEDFESYAPGSNLVGQNGWAGSGPGGISAMTIKAGTYLDTQVLDGRDSAGTGWIMYAGHTVPSPSASEVTTLQADAYATTSPATINSGFGIGNEPAPNGIDYPNSFVLAWTVNAPNGAWYFDTRAIGGAIEAVNAGIDEEVSLQIVIDGPAGEAYGVLQADSIGRHETAHVAITRPVIEALDAVALQVDKSTVRTGASFDNLQLSAVAPKTFADWVSDQGLPAGQQGPLDDPDKDGITNLVTCFTRGPGTKVTHTGLPKVVAAPNNQFCIVYQRAKARLDLTGIIEVSTDGKNWNFAPPPMKVIDKGVTEEVTTDMLKNYAEAQKLMARLRVTLEDR